MSSGCRVRWSASGRRGAEADDARTREVGPRHSSWEVGEQSGAPLRSNPRGSQPQRSRWSQGRGPRGMRTGKARTGLSARLACHRRRNACGNCLPFGPEVGAVCGKAARTVLCGGRAMKRASLPLQWRMSVPAQSSPKRSALVESGFPPIAAAMVRRTERLLCAMSRPSGRGQHGTIRACTAFGGYASFQSKPTEYSPTGWAGISVGTI